MGLFKWAKKQLNLKSKNVDLENDKWINIKIEIARPKEKVEEEKSLFEEQAHKIGWKSYIERLDTNKFDFGKDSDNLRDKEYFILGIEPPEYGMISPRELSKNLLTYRKIAFWVFNINAPKSKDGTKLSFGTFDWRIDINPKDISQVFFRIYKPCIEIRADLNQVIALHNKNPSLCKKAFYFSLKEIYDDYLKMSKSKSKSSEDITKAKLILKILKENGYE